MKIVKQKKDQAREFITYSQRLKISTIEGLDRVVRREGISRNALVEAIVRQALDDDTFVLRVKK